jgi:hypothetical protein
MDVVCGGAAGVDQGQTERELGGDRRGERAAGAVGVQIQSRVADLPMHPAAAFAPRRKQIDHLIAARQMPAFQQHRTGAKIEQRIAGVAHRVEVGNGPAEEEFRFQQIRRDHRRHR